LENIIRRLTRNKSKEIRVFTTWSQADKLTYASAKEASKSLGIPRTSLNRYINLIKYPLFSPTLGKNVFIIDPNKPFSDGKPLLTKGTETPITGIDFKSLTSGVVYAFLPDKKTIFGKFKSTHEAALKLDNKKTRHYISRYVNKERLVKVGSKQTPVYFVKKNKALPCTLARLRLKI
jgi:hypothetical protein